MDFCGHFKTINRHKALVFRYCLLAGLPVQAVLHDLSKYTPTELYSGIKYYVGTKSPNSAEREEKGYSSAWLHHKGRNLHHFEYWTDCSRERGNYAVEMPVEYVVEMFCDRIAACRTYHGNAYLRSDPWNYYASSNIELAPQTRILLETLLILLRDRGERETFSYIRKKVLGDKCVYNHIDFGCADETLRNIMDKAIIRFACVGLSAGDDFCDCEDCDSDDFGEQEDGMPSVEIGDFGEK